MSILRLCNTFNRLSLPSTRLVAVDRELPSRVPMIEFVCSAAEGIFNDCYPLLKKLGQWECSHDFFVSDAEDRADERGKDQCDADFRGIIVQAALGDKRLTMTPGS